MGPSFWAGGVKLLGGQSQASWRTGTSFLANRTKLLGGGGKQIPGLAEARRQDVGAKFSRPRFQVSGPTQPSFPADGWRSHVSRKADPSGLAQPSFLANG